MQIAIDGPAASGKSAAARMLAKKLGFLYIDTGAMYRAVTLLGIENGIDFADQGQIIKTAGEINIEIEGDWSVSRGYRIFADGRDVTSHLFTPPVDALVSVTAKVGDVRRIMVEAQRRMAREADVVMAGRDIGSHVLKGASLKVFLTASPQVRAERRRLELEKSGRTEPFERILENIVFRDRTDSERSDSPLIKTDDALLLDNSDMTIEETVDAIYKAALDRMKNLPKTGC